MQSENRENLVLFINKKYRPCLQKIEEIKFYFIAANPKNKYLDYIRKIYLQISITFEKRLFFNNYLIFYNHQTCKKFNNLKDCNVEF